MFSQVSISLSSYSAKQVKMKYGVHYQSEGLSNLETKIPLRSQSEAGNIRHFPISIINNQKASIKMQHCPPSFLFIYL